MLLLLPLEREREREREMGEGVGQYSKLTNTRGLCRTCENEFGV